MVEFLARLFRSDFLPHGVCYRWSSDILWLHVTSDLLIALAYYFIPFALIYIARNRKDLVFPWMFWLFGVFILACGTTHLMNIWVIWTPVYRLDGVIKAVTAIASVFTAIMLLRLAPAILTIPSPADLREANRNLQNQIVERTAAEDQVRRLNAELELRVQERTRELQEANNLLRESEARMQSILDESPALVYLKDLTGRMLFVNRRFEETVELRRSDILGKTDYELFPENAANAYREVDARVMNSGEPMEVEEDLYLDGAKHTYVSIKFPLLDSSQKAYALCGWSRDITDRKKAEQALRQYNAELEQFAYVAAHDLQEPLRTVKTYTQFLDRRYRDVIDGDGRQFLYYIVSGVERMSTLISDLHVYTETANRRVPSRDDVDLNGVIQETLRHLQTAIVESSAKITCAELPTVRANTGQMGQLFQNLISNAIKYCGGHIPQIEIDVSRTGRDWKVCVKDYGIGLDMRYAEQIFGVFKRLHGREVPGTGIGLAICKQVVEQHGGQIWVESAPGAGASFFFTLPV